MVIAVVLSSEGFPLAYEVMAGNTSDKTTLRMFLDKIQAQYGKANRIWIMDRGIPTEKTLGEMRQSDPPISYLAGGPRARWDEFKEEFAKLPWQWLGETVQVKLLCRGDEVYVLAKSQGRRSKEWPLFAAGIWSRGSGHFALGDEHGVDRNQSSFQGAGDQPPNR